MNLNFIELLPPSFSGSSRVWIYQSNRLFTMSEAFQIEEILNAFVADWKSHGADVKGFGTLFFGQFIVLMADESNISVGGCSTDSSVRMIKEIEKGFKVSMFERTNLAFVVKDKIQLLPLSQLPYAIENGFINEDTLFFDNTVLDKNALVERWILPAGKSWLAKKFQLASTK